MSPDEVLALIAAGAFALWRWFRWFRPALRLRHFLRGGMSDAVVFVGPPCALALLYAVLAVAAASDVRDDPRYIAFYLVLGAAWIGGMLSVGGMLGIESIDDMIERSNPAAAIAVGGALLGHTFAFAGANIGDGPGWWVVLFSAGLATSAIFLSWWLLEIFTRISERVGIERNIASGWRLAGLLASVGLVAGRSAAGNWISASATVTDFCRQVWPSGGLVAAAVLLELALPSRTRAAGTFLNGMVPAAALFAVAVLWVLHLGPW